MRLLNKRMFCYKPIMLSVVAVLLLADSMMTRISGQVADVISQENYMRQKEVVAELQRNIKQWVADALQSDSSSELKIRTIRQGWGVVQFSQSINKEPLNIHGRPFEWGLGTHADSEISIAGGKMARIQGFAGVDENNASRGRSGTQQIFTIEANGKVLWQSPTLTLNDAPVVFDVPLGDSTSVILKSRELRQNNLEFSHSDWAESVITMTDGRKVKLGQVDKKNMLAPAIPFTFVYDGKPSSELLYGWQKTAKSDTLADGCVLHTVTWRDPATRLECTLELTEYPDFPAIEWIVYFRNTGEQDTPILQNIQAMNLSGRTNRTVVLHRSHGSFFDKDDFLYCQDEIAPGKNIVMTPVEGRSSTQWLPFYNVALPTTKSEGLNFLQVPAAEKTERGVIFAIGWSGNWKSTSAVNNENLIELSAGLERTHLKLHPGERIRMPRMLMLNWRGRPIDGNNMLRQFMLKYHRPVVDGKPAMAPLTNGTWGGMKTSLHLERITELVKQKLPYEYYWIDAAWYGPAHSYSSDTLNNEWARHVGNWNINPTAHPDGLKPIADAAHKAGFKFLLWFEPERAVWGTPITVEHPEWFLRPKTGDNALLNLGDPAARKWATSLVAGMISKVGIDCYRQDFNMDPLPYWHAADASDRIGMTEIRHIEGLYQFWDDLRAQFPNLLIDNCASGGRRIDIETLSRSIPLWRSDVQCFPNYQTICSQVQTDGLNRWVPLNACGTEVLNTGNLQADTYRVRSCFSSGLVMHIFPQESVPISASYPYGWHRKMMQDFLRAKPMFYGNFYPLCPTSQSEKTWAVFQYHRSDLNQGIVQVFRRAECPYVQADLALNELAQDATYEVEDADTGKCQTLSGKELTERGLPVTVEKTNMAKLFFYHKL